MCASIVARLCCDCVLFKIFLCVRRMAAMRVLQLLRIGNTVAILQRSATPTPKIHACARPNPPAQILQENETAIRLRGARDPEGRKKVLDIRGKVCHNGPTMESFVRLREVLTPTGVYALLRQGTVVYVGKSENVFARLSKHYTNQQRVLRGLPPYHGHEGPSIQFDDCWVRWCPYDQLDMIETQMIQQYRPEHNVLYNRPAYDLSHIPAFRELLEKAKRRPSVMRRTRRTMPSVPRWQKPERRMIRVVA